MIQALGEAAISDPDARLPAAAKSLQILLIEYEVFHQKVVVGLLKNRGDTVETAKDDRQALDWLAATNFDSTLIDL